MSIWGDTFNRYLRKGHDHGSAAYAADQAERRATRTNSLTCLLTRAREYVADALDAYEHSDGRDLLTEIDAALSPAPDRAGKSGGRS